MKTMQVLLCGLLIYLGIIACDAGERMVESQERTIVIEKTAEAGNPEVPKLAPLAKVTKSEVVPCSNMFWDHTAAEKSFPGKSAIELSTVRALLVLNRPVTAELKYLKPPMYVGDGSVGVDCGLPPDVVGSSVLFIWEE